MPDFRRYYIPNAIVFITSVTRDRVPYLQSQKDVNLFWETSRRVQKIHPFRILAHVILPDHFHWLMRPDGPKGNFSKIMHSVKRNYTLNYKKLHDVNTPLNIWQERFWDHIVRDENDLNMHFDYIHWNPVKHDYTVQPENWPHSSYSHWVERGFYPKEWGKQGEPMSIKNMHVE
jgi:putative transposase